MADKTTDDKLNKGEWSEPYAALRIMSDRRLYIADSEGEKNQNEWLDVVRLLRHETETRQVVYGYDSEGTDVIVEVNNKEVVSVPLDLFTKAADQLLSEIHAGSGTFTVSKGLGQFFDRIELTKPKAKSFKKSDVFLDVCDPRAGVRRNCIGFSVKSELGHDSTLFNTAPASAAIYQIVGCNDELMEKVNAAVNRRGHAAVHRRCELITAAGAEAKFVGWPNPKGKNYPVFRENLDMMNPRLPMVIERMLWNHYFGSCRATDLHAIVETIARENPCDVVSPQTKYPYMVKAFLYASYCNMTASKPWDGRSDVNGGLIKVKENGEIVAYYALESDSFKDYLYENCYLDEPSTSAGHGNYGSIYKEKNMRGEDIYLFRLNFQIRYR